MADMTWSDDEESEFEEEAEPKEVVNLCLMAQEEVWKTMRYLVSIYFQ